jgi:hypothetical protein
MWLIVLRLDVPTVTTSHLPKRSWQSEVELYINLILDIPTFTISHLPRDPSSQRWNYVGEKWPMNFAWSARLPRSIQGSFTCRKSTTWDRRLYFPSKGRRAEDFFALNNSMATKGQHATSRPPKPLNHCLELWVYLINLIKFSLGAYYQIYETCTSHKIIHMWQCRFRYDFQFFKNSFDMNIFWNKYIKCQYWYIS